MIFPFESGRYPHGYDHTSSPLLVAGFRPSQPSRTAQSVVLGQKREIGQGSRLRSCGLALPKRTLYQTELYPVELHEHTLPQRAAVSTLQKAGENARNPYPAFAVVPTRSLYTGSKLASPTNWRPIGRSNPSHRLDRPAASPDA